MPDTDEQLNLSDFEDRVGETLIFSTANGEQKVEATLVKAETLRSGKASGEDRQPFFLEFRFPVKANIGQCTLNVESATGDRLSPMFLVPRGSDESGWYMDATFN
jgi:hypothetical protein